MVDIFFHILGLSVYNYNYVRENNFVIFRPIIKIKLAIFRINFRHIGRLSMADIRRIYGGHRADVRRTYGRSTADRRLTYGGYTAGIRRTYGWHTADIRQMYGRKLKYCSSYKKQLWYPYNHILRISFWPYISRIFDVCQPHISCKYRPHNQFITKNLESVFGRISGVFPAYVGRISDVYQPYIRRQSAVCPPYIRRMSAVCQSWNGRMSAKYQQYVSRMSAVCQPVIRRMSAIPNLPICHFVTPSNLQTKVTSKLSYLYVHHRNSFLYKMWYMPLATKATQEVYLYCLPACRYITIEGHVKIWGEFKENEALKRSRMHWLNYVGMAQLIKYTRHQ